MTIDLLREGIERLVVNDLIAEGAGRLANRYAQSHPGIDPIDYIIAATAHATTANEGADAQSWTRNVKHFPCSPTSRLPTDLDESSPWIGCVRPMALTRGSVRSTIHRESVRLTGTEAAPVTSNGTTATGDIMNRAGVNTADTTTTRSGLVAGTAVAAILAGCSASIADPVFESEDVVAAVGCSDDRLCIEVRAPVDGNREGEGSCALYGPGSPDDLEPLAESGDLKMHPGGTTVWRVDVESTLEIADLNPVCQPMMEG